MKTNNPFNYKPYEGKIFTQPSMTVPDETMSIRELLSRHVNGLPVENGKVPLYDEDESSDGINPKTLDLTDWDELKRNAAATIKKHKANLAKAQQKEMDAKTTTQSVVPEGQ